VLLISETKTSSENFDLISDDIHINSTSSQNSFRSLNLSNNIDNSIQLAPSEDILQQNGSSKLLSDFKDFIQRTILPFIRSSIGLAIITLSVVVLWFNEKRTVDMARIVNFGEKACEDIVSAQYDAEINGELIYLTGNTSTSCQLHDQTFGVHLKDGIKLKRVVEVYQTREHKVNKGSLFRDQQYKYENTWCEYMNPSAMFHTESMRDANNSVKFIVHKMTFTSDTVELGDFKLTPYQIQRLDKWTPLDLNGTSGITFSRDLKEKLNNLKWEKPIVQVKDNVVNIKQNEGEEPKIGDIRVSFYQMPCDVVTIIAEQAGITFKPYNIKERRFIKKSESEKATLMDEEELQLDLSLEKGVDRCCWGVFCYWADSRIKNPLKVRETIDFIYPGQISKKDFFTKQIKVEKWYFTNLLRILGTLFLALGLFISFEYAIDKMTVVKLLSQVFGYAKLAGTIGLGGLGSLLVAGFAWMFYRKLVGFIIILLAASILGGIFVCQELKFD